MNNSQEKPMKTAFNPLDGTLNKQGASVTVENKLKSNTETLEKTEVKETVEIRRYKERLQLIEQAEKEAKEKLEAERQKKEIQEKLELSNKNFPKDTVEVRRLKERMGIIPTEEVPENKPSFKPLDTDNKETLSMLNVDQSKKKKPWYKFW